MAGNPSERGGIPCFPARSGKGVLVDGKAQEKEHLVVLEGPKTERMPVAEAGGLARKLRNSSLGGESELLAAKN